MPHNAHIFRTLPLLVLMLPTAVLAQATPGHTINRPGALSATQLQARLKTTNQHVSQLPHMQRLIDGDRIAGVNGDPHATLEPGGDYRITGKGFGTRSQTVVLLIGQHQVPLQVNAWSDQEIYAHVPANVSGQPDGPATLMVAGSKGLMRASGYSFRAAREDQDLQVTRDMIQSDPALGGIDPTIGPSSTDAKSGYLHVYRSVADDGDSHKRCFTPGTDRIHAADIGLKPGFEVTGYVWYYDNITSRDSNGTENDARGSFSADWQGSDVVIHYGVQRWHTPRFVAIGAGGGCTSHYWIKLVVTGPSGMSPQ